MRKSRSHPHPHVKAIFEIRIDGKLVKRGVSRSFVVGFISTLYFRTSAINTTGVVDTSGTTHTGISLANNDLQCDAASANDNFGVVVGTGTSAVSPSDHSLGTKISTGSGSGQLSYGVVTFGAPSSDSTSNSYNIIRTFVNNSGASITVNEIGIVWEVTNTPYYVLWMRDLTGGVAVAAGKTMTVSYTIKGSI